MAINTRRRAAEANRMQDVVMYTTPLCGYCYLARKLLNAKGVEFTEINVMMAAGMREEMVSRSAG